MVIYDNKEITVEYLKINNVINRYKQELEEVTSRIIKHRKSNILIRLIRYANYLSLDERRQELKALIYAYNN